PSGRGRNALRPHRRWTVPRGSHRHGARSGYTPPGADRGGSRRDVGEGEDTGLKAAGSRQAKGEARAWRIEEAGWFLLQGGEADEFSTTEDVGTGSGRRD